jgi:hypothetical protein
MRGHRFLAAGAICVALAAVSHGASAAGGKALDGSYFFGSCTDCVLDTATIAGQTIRGTAIILRTANSDEQISLNARKLPACTAVTFLLGCDDHDSLVGASVVLQVLGDGKAPLGTYTVTQGQAARQAIVPFKGHGAISFVAKAAANYKECDVTLATPLAIVLGGPKAAALTLAPASVAAGAQETVSALAPAGTQGTIVVTYASGQQQVLGPTRAGAAGRLTTTFTVAQGASGTARVVVVTANGVVQGTFTVTS